MRTALLTLIAAGAFACAKEQPAPRADTELATAAATAETAEAPSCASPEMAAQCGKAGKQEEGGGCNQWDEEAAAVAGRTVPDDAVWKTLKVSGMTCGGCERRVIAHVGKLDGVVGVEADAELGQVRVAMASGSADAAQAAAAEITRLGYRVE